MKIKIPPSGSFQHVTIGLLTVLLLAGLLALAYWHAPDNVFHFDDLDNIVNAPAVRLDHLSFDGLVKAGQQAFLPSRPLPSVTFALNWWQGGGDPKQFQWTNLALHAVNTILVFLLLAIALGRLFDGEARHRVWLAVGFGVAIWAVHPIQVQSVTYIVQRMNLMAGLFAMLSLLLYIRGRLWSRRPWLCYMGAGLSMLLGVMSKENAYITPALILLAEFGLCRHNREMGKSVSDKILLALPVVLLVFVAIDLVGQLGPVWAFVGSGYEGRDFTIEERLLTQPRVIFFHLGQIFWPLPGRFSLEHDFVVSTGLWQPSTTSAALVGLLCWGITGLYCLFRSNLRVVGFLLLWPFFNLAIESSFIPLEMVFEHRFYLPLLGVAGLGAVFLMGLGKLSVNPSLRLVVFLAAAAIPVLLALSSRNYVALWSDPLKLAENTVRHAPLKSRPWAGLGHQYLKEGKVPEALSATQRALELNPQDLLALEDLAVIRMDQRRYREAEKLLSRVIVHSSRHTVLNHLGEVYFHLGDHARALNLYSQAITAAPWVANYIWNISLAYEKLNRCEKALSGWQRFLRMSDSAEDRRMVRSHLDENFPGESCGTNH